MTSLSTVAPVAPVVVVPYHDDGDEEDEEEATLAVILKSDDNGKEIEKDDDDDEAEDDAMLAAMMSSPVPSLQRTKSQRSVFRAVFAPDLDLEVGMAESNHNNNNNNNKQSKIDAASVGSNNQGLKRFTTGRASRSTSAAGAGTSKVNVDSSASVNSLASKGSTTSLFRRRLLFRRSQQKANPRNNNVSLNSGMTAAASRDDASATAAAAAAATAAVTVTVTARPATTLSRQQQRDLDRAEQQRRTEQQRFVDQPAPRLVRTSSHTDLYVIDSSRLHPSNNNNKAEKNNKTSNRNGLASRLLRPLLFRRNRRDGDRTATNADATDPPSSTMDAGSVSGVQSLFAVNAKNRTSSHDDDDDQSHNDGGGTIASSPTIFMSSSSYRRPQLQQQQQQQRNHRSVAVKNRYSNKSWNRSQPTAAILPALPALRPNRTVDGKEPKKAVNASSVTSIQDNNNVSKFTSRSQTTAATSSKAPLLSSSTASTTTAPKRHHNEASSSGSSTFVYPPSVPSLVESESHETGEKSKKSSIKSSNSSCDDSHAFASTGNATATSSTDAVATKETKRKPSPAHRHPIHRSALHAVGVLESPISPSRHASHYNSSSKQSPRRAIAESPALRDGASTDQLPTSIVMEEKDHLDNESPDVLPSEYQKRVRFLEAALEYVAAASETVDLAALAALQPNMIGEADQAALTQWAARFVMTADPHHQQIATTSTPSPVLASGANPTAPVVVTKKLRQANEGDDDDDGDDSYDWRPLATQDDASPDVSLPENGVNQNFPSVRESPIAATLAHPHTAMALDSNWFEAFFEEHPVDMVHHDVTKGQLQSHVAASPRDDRKDFHPISFASEAAWKAAASDLRAVEPNHSPVRRNNGLDPQQGGSTLVESNNQNSAMTEQGKNQSDRSSEQEDYDAAAAAAYMKTMSDEEMVSLSSYEYPARSGSPYSEDTAFEQLLTEIVDSVDVIVTDDEQQKEKVMHYDNILHDFSLQLNQAPQESAFSEPTTDDRVQSQTLPEPLLQVKEEQSCDHVKSTTRKGKKKKKRKGRRPNNSSSKSNRHSPKKNILPSAILDPDEFEKVARLLLVDSDDDDDNVSRDNMSIDTDDRNGPGMDHEMDQPAKGDESNKLLVQDAQTRTRKAREMECEPTENSDYSPGEGDDERVESSSAAVPQGNHVVGTADDA